MRPPVSYEKYREHKHEFTDMPESLRTIQKRLTDVRWYKQGGAVVPLTVSYPGLACLGFTIRGRRVSKNYTPFGWYLIDDYFDVYFPRDVMRAIGSWYDNQECRHRGFIHALKQRWERASQRFFTTIAAVDAEDLTALSDRALFALFQDFSRQHDALWREAVFLDAFDVSSEEILEAVGKETGVTLSNGDLATLTAPRVLSTLQCERQALMRLASRRAEVKTLTRHADKFHWIYNDYAVIRRLDWRFFKKEIEELRAHRKQWYAEAAVIRAVNRLPARIETLRRTHHLPKRFMDTCTMIATLAEWRDLRKSMNQRANAVVERFAGEWSRRSGLVLREVMYLWWWEIRELLQRSTVQGLRRRAHARMQGCLIFGANGRNHFFYGARGRAFRKYFEDRFGVGSTVEGRPAYPGVVRGRAKCILTQRDFKKMRRGDILIAPNTRPEYVPIMKIAGAIISEEGGITCHTAIVSRELRIPAVVGAQGALKAFRDNDMIEVDAEQGIVRKL